MNRLLQGTPNKYLTKVGNKYLNTLRNAKTKHVSLAPNKTSMGIVSELNDS